MLEKGGVAWIVLWLPLTLTTILWLLGLALVLTIPPITFLLGFLLWTIAWIPVIVLPPLLYVLGWVFIVFGLPSLYLLLWVIVLVGPWVFVALGMVSGPVLALKIVFDEEKQAEEPKKETAAEVAKGSLSSPADRAGQPRASLEQRGVSSKAHFGGSLSTILWGSSIE